MTLKNFRLESRLKNLILKDYFSQKALEKAPNKSCLNIILNIYFKKIKDILIAAKIKIDIHAD